MAIARDTTATGSSSFSSSLTYSHTLTATPTNGIILCGVTAKTNPTGGLTATYNGVSMTQIKTAVEAGDPFYLFLFYCFTSSMATGAHNMVISCSPANISLMAGSASYTGAAQSGQPDATASNTSGGSVSPHTCALTTVTANSWYFGWATLSGSGGGETQSGGDNILFAGALNGNDCVMFDSNAGVTAGSHTIGYVNIPGGFDAFAMVAGSFAPPGSGGGSLIVPSLIIDQAVKRASFY